MSRFLIFTCCVVLFTCTGCDKINLFERIQTIKGGNWDKQQEPSFTFDISDTTRDYRIYVLVRHTNEYAYRNIWLNIGLQMPGDTMKRQNFEIPLATADRWLGKGMDDIYEYRASLFPQPVHFSKIGPVTFSLKQIMRLNPLPGVLQAGIRVEAMPVTN